MKGQFASLINIGFAVIASFLGSYSTPILIGLGILAAFVIFTIVRNSQGETADSLERAQERETDYIENEATNVEVHKEQEMEKAEEEFQKDLEDPPEDLDGAIDSQIHELKDRYEE